MRQPLLIHLASIPVVPPVRMPRGRRVVWLAGAGLYALQARHNCRDDRGRFTPCSPTCPVWDGLYASKSQDVITAHLTADTNGSAP